ncbi:C40 family peptidase [Geodermatophilus poikilotrophus]|uniref:Cell wall-associated hydrolase, NlpC family n=1 Tax=Geodermatophilus poikilotrophus TaxID=1333667 RepID=A0A1I0CUT4_9ACTN|nr:C40 family peptidase [Geodermatophilus poikilotrophus]SET23054.1 Cell wall-associated hydrolase, NlpC family [Geodermatophilus poikilotrophus]
MTTARTSFARRSFRGVAVAAIAGAGIALSPLPASAAVGGAAGPVLAAAPAPAAASSSAAQKAVDTALAQRGDMYLYGATGPDRFDCSGLTSFAYKAAGVSIPRTSKAQSTFGTPVSKANLKPGDLVFFYSPVSHVGMYIGNGQMVHSSSAGKPVSVVNVDSMPSYAGARRVA